MIDNSRTCRIKGAKEDLQHGNYSRKCKVLRDVMVMEKATEIVAPGKKRKLTLEELEDIRSSSVQLKTRRLADATPVNFGTSTCESSSSDCALASCCSSNGSSELAKVQEEEGDEATVHQFLVTSNGDTDPRESRETSSEIQVDSGELETTEKPNESKPHRCFTGEKMPSDDDLEEFFASAEKNLQKQFIDKYNYDIVKDEPFEGRFEWVQIKEIKP